MKRKKTNCFIFLYTHEKWFFLKFSKLQKKYLLVLVKDLSQNCTIQYASWKNKQRQDKIRNSTITGLKDVLLKALKSFQSLVLITSHSIHFKIKSHIKENKKLLFQAKIDTNKAAGKFLKCGT